MKLCFLMYPWNRINPEIDSTLRLIHEATLRGHTVALTTPNNLTIRDTVAHAFCKVLRKGDQNSKYIPTFYRKAEYRRSKLPLAGFDAIIMRANPSLNTIALNFLDSVRNDTFIVNDIDGLRIANNKPYTASFSVHAKSYIPTTHVSKNKDYLASILSESESEKMIMKPLNGFGGQASSLLRKVLWPAFTRCSIFILARAIRATTSSCKTTSKGPKMVMFAS